MKWGESGPQNKPIFEGTGKMNVVEDSEDNRGDEAEKLTNLFLSF